MSSPFHIQDFLAVTICVMLHMLRPLKKVALVLRKRVSMFHGSLSVSHSPVHAQPRAWNFLCFPLASMLDDNVYSILCGFNGIFGMLELFTSRVLTLPIAGGDDIVVFSFSKYEKPDLHKEHFQWLLGQSWSPCGVQNCKRAASNKICDPHDLENVLLMTVCWDKGFVWVERLSRYIRRHPNLFCINFVIHWCSCWQVDALLTSGLSTMQASVGETSSFET